ncbi:MAG TPA: (2Fe-2S)-binding protein [Candidatus Fimisoma avicola]|uniref:(2Fe-2S)-binding protein n=1 Tax=Candidatus Fimisoma avicola TaxID=2840826 RepID=A0A9D1I4H7_9FIRM|nr:(2Fe-2S)-binding protein [Candidatus Fimisoma avicola]
MKYMTINNRRVPFENEKNVLTVIRNAGIELPTFCYHSELSTYGACRMCIVEDDRGKIFASCSEEPKDGMVIYTNTPKLQHHRKMILELLLASHCTDCTTCRTNGACILLKLANQLGVNYVRFQNHKPVLPLDDSSPCIVYDPNKCILCGDCVRTCAEIQGLGIIDFVNRGSKMRVSTAFGRPLSETACVGCGQCRVVCPTGAITVNQNIHPVWEALADRNTKVVVQIAPAVRVAIGDKFGLPKGENALGKLVAALKLMGFDQVYDTNFGADLTVVEEAAELVEKIKEGDLPLFTSCCPAWVKFCEEKYPDLKKHISSCRSPQQMFGAVLKEESRMDTSSEKKKTVVVSIMPCTAKKAEILRPEHYTDGEQNVDYVLTTTEITRMIKEAGIDLAQIKPDAMDMPFGLSSGGGAIFGVTGGVTEAVLRQLVDSYNPDDLEMIKLTGIRGNDGIKEATVTLHGREVHIGVVNGLKNAAIVMDGIRSGEMKFDFVEVMACRSGCIAGGGQPVPVFPKIKDARAEGLYDIDDEKQIKISSDNPFVLSLYDGLLKGKEHKLLHNHVE